MNDNEHALDDFSEFIQHLDLPEATCDQVHPTVEAFLDNVDPADPDWSGEFSDWMVQANSCLTSEIQDVVGPPPTDPDELDTYLWTVIRLSWIFYQKYHDGKPFNS